MRLHKTVVAILLALSLPLLASEPIPLDRVLGKRELCISDGSSIFRFLPDRRFLLEPVGISGRTIEGTWEEDGNKIRVVGRWSWINGLSAEDDFREMDLHIGNLRGGTREHRSPVSGVRHTIHDCYFLVERLEKKPRKEEE